MLLKELSRNRDAPLEEFSSTLLFTAVRASKNHIEYVVGQLGDGVVGIRVGGEPVQLALEPSKGRHVNETYFVTATSALEHFQVSSGSLNGAAGFILLSDGAAESLYSPKTKRFGRGCDLLINCFAECPQPRAQRILDQNLITLRNASKTGDDCSAAVLSYRLGGRRST